MIVWTPDLDGLLARMAEEGCSFGEIAHRLGCTRGAVAGRVRRLGINGVARSIRADGWTREQDAILRVEWDRGADCADISRRLGGVRTPIACRARARVLGLARRVTPGEPDPPNPIVGSADPCRVDRLLRRFSWERADETVRARRHG